MSRSLFSLLIFIGLLAGALSEGVVFGKTFIIIKSSLFLYCRIKHLQYLWCPEVGVG